MKTAYYESEEEPGDEWEEEPGELDEEPTTVQLSTPYDPKDHHHHHHHHDGDAKPFAAAVAVGATATATSQVSGVGVVLREADSATKSRSYVPAAAAAAGPGVVSMDPDDYFLRKSAQKVAASRSGQKMSATATAPITPVASVRDLTAFDDDHHASAHKMSPTASKYLDPNCTVSGRRVDAGVVDPPPAVAAAPPVAAAAAPSQRFRAAATAVAVTSGRQSDAAAKARAVRDIFANHGPAAAPGVDMVDGVADRSSANSDHRRGHVNHTTTTNNNNTATNITNTSNNYLNNSNHSNHNNLDNSRHSSVGGSRHGRSTTGNHSGHGRPTTVSEENALSDVGGDDPSSTSSAFRGVELRSNAVFENDSAHHVARHRRRHSAAAQSILADETEDVEDNDENHTNNNDNDNNNDNGNNNNNNNNNDNNNNNNDNNNNNNNNVGAPLLVAAVEPVSAPLVAEVCDDYVYAADVVGVDVEEELLEQETDRKAFVRRVGVASIAVFVFVVVVTVPTAVFLLRPKVGSPTAAPTAPPTGRPTTRPTMARFVDVAEALSRVETSDLYGRHPDHHHRNSSSSKYEKEETNFTVDDHAATINDTMKRANASPPPSYLLDKRVLLNTSSPQYRAVEWLSSYSDDSSSFHLLSPAALVQRYVLGVFYFSLGGDDWTSCSRLDSVCVDNRRPYLDPDSHECEWFGNICDGDDGRVTTLKLVNNGLAGTLATETGALTSLKYLYLENNAVEGTLPPTWGAHMTQLSQVRLSRNRLRSPLPSSFFDMPRLTTLFMDENDFTGTIPTGFARMGSLTKIFLHSNGFNGTIPAGVFGRPTTASLVADDVVAPRSTTTTTTKRRRLEILSLSYNNLSGTVPQDVLAVDTLQQLALDGNRLSGVLPYQIGAMTSLRVLMLSGNRLMGDLPDGLFLLRDLRHVSLFNNELSGTVPTEFGTLSELVTLNLSFNSFSGTIPTELAACQGLRRLLLQGNELRAEVPAAVCERIDNHGLEAQLSVDCAGATPKVECACCACHEEEEEEGVG